MLALAAAGALFVFGSPTPTRATARPGDGVRAGSCSEGCDRKAAECLDDCEAKFKDDKPRVQCKMECANVRQKCEKDCT